MTTPENSSSRASEVWRRFTGMFGGDALERKFGKSIPPEWGAMLGRLKDYEIDRGIRRLAYSGKAHVPALPEFVKLCRTIANDEVDEGPRPVAMLTSDQSTFDRWDIAGNLHFLGYVTRTLTAEVRKWGMPNSAQQRDATLVAVKYKNAWATDMREWGIDEATGELIEPTPEQQETAWDECMRMAEAEIAQLFVRAAA